jgi:hypothetical protein
MPPLPARSLSISDSINVSGVALTVGIGILALIIAYATLRLQQYLHRRHLEAHPVHELEAQPTHELETLIPETDRGSETPEDVLSQENNHCPSIATPSR